MEELRESGVVTKIRYTEWPQFEPLVRRILEEGRVEGDRILKIDHFINHRIEPSFMRVLGQALAERIAPYEPDLLLTAEASGIAPALATAMALDVDLVYAKKYSPLAAPVSYSRLVPSPTKGVDSLLAVSGLYIREGMRVALIDDFLANGRTAIALAEIVADAGAHPVVAAFLVEKLFQGGRRGIEALDIPVVALASIDRLENGRVIMAE
ncbi:MAG: phosphoribosyltransferase family protein [Chloroflexota bacterium]